MALPRICTTTFKVSPAGQGVKIVKAEVMKIEEVVDKPQPVNLTEVLRKVRILESSGGKNDKCVRKGKGFNGYGYGQSYTKDNCYSSVAEVEAQVTKWFEKKLQTMDLPTALCHYNIGYKVNDCEYYKNYLKLP